MSPNEPKSKKEILKRIIDFTYHKYVILFILLLCALVLFKDFFYRINILDNIQPSIEGDLLFVVGSIGIIFRYFYLAIVERYIFSQKVSLFVIEIGLLYAVFRFLLRDYWIYTPLDCINYKSIVYADVILIPFACLVIIMLVRYFLKGKQEPKNNIKLLSPHLDNDNDNDNDGYNRKPSASYFINEVLNIECDQAVAVGIIGPWGSGKTRYMEMMHDSIRNEVDKIVIEFNPWRISAQKEMTIDFFDVLKDKLSIYNGNLNQAIDAYVGSILKLEKNGLGEALFNLLNRQKSTETEFKVLKEEIKRIERKVLVFIDDLDRLEKREVLEVLKLIRNTANFPNIYFVVGYDKNHLLNVIGEEFKYNPDKYLDKIFQIEKPLPVIPNYLIINRFREELEKISNSKSELKDKILRNKYNRDVGNLDSSVEVFCRSLSNLAQDLKSGGELTKIFQETIVNNREFEKLRNSYFLNCSQMIKYQLNLRDLLLLQLLQIRDYNTAFYFKIYKTHLLGAHKFAYQEFFIKNIQKRRNPTVSEFGESMILLESHSQGEGLTERILKLLLSGSLKIYGKNSILEENYFDCYFEYNGTLELLDIVNENWANKKVEIDRYIKDGRGNELIYFLEGRIGPFFEQIGVYQSYVQLFLYVSDKLAYSINIEKLVNFEVIRNLYGNDLKSGITFLKNTKANFEDQQQQIEITLLFYKIEQEDNINDICSLLISICNAKLITEKAISIERKLALYKPQKDSSRIWLQSIIKSKGANAYGLLDISPEQLRSNRLNLFIEQLIKLCEDSVLKLECLTFYRRLVASNFEFIEFKKGTLDFISDSSTFFTHSKVFHDKKVEIPAVEFVHPWHKSAEKLYDALRGVKWIRKDPETESGDGSREVDTYYFKRKIQIPTSVENITSVKIRFMVDSMVTLKIDNEEIGCDEVVTGDRMLGVLELKISNEFELGIEVTDDPIKGEINVYNNPYGIIYIIEVELRDTNL